MSNSTQYLSRVIDALEPVMQVNTQSDYHVPRLWTEDVAGAKAVNPARYYHDILSGIAMEPKQPLSCAGAGPDQWTRHAVIYNIFTRLTTAFDHNADTCIGSTALDCGFRETGTFLKSIAILPYIKRLGANTVYLLPVTAPGQYRKKGSLGSPYAVKNPYKIDPLLQEPALGLDPETELKAFIEAAHHTGIRVVMEFVFRTAAADSDWIAEHPDWFYWKHEHAEVSPAASGPPHFDSEALNRIYEQVDKHDFHALPAPGREYREQFCDPPEKVTVTAEGAFQGTDREGNRCRIASAFSDWPPDDTQPLWTDVTYLRLHTHREFNYIAYNTIRMYDEALDNPDTVNTELWEKLTGIIPFYQNSFGIDGAMIDMGHALPPALKSSIVARARSGKPDFAFWDENFDPSPSIKKEGFNAVFGSLPFVIQDPIYIRGLLNFLNKTGVAVPFFATGENHNTPRVCFRMPEKEAGRNRSRFIFTLGAMLPAVSFIHSGMELCEWHPVNLGLNFTEDDRKAFPPERLPLFNASAYDWSGTNNLLPLNSFIRKVLVIRERYHDIICNGSKGSLVLPFVSAPEVLAVMRKGTSCNLLFIGNSDCENHAEATLEFGSEKKELKDLITATDRQIVNHRLELKLEPGECLIFEIPS